MMRIVSWLGVLVAWLCLAPLGQAQNYADLATVSATMGVNDSRVCLGEGSRNDIGCPTYAPFVDSLGRVGLGLTSPQTALDISATDARVRSVGANSSNGMIWGSRSDAASGWGQFYWSDGFGTALGSGQNLAIFTGGTAGGSGERIRITAAGLVGINNTNPSSTLHVIGEVQVASSGGACNANTAGAIRYTGGTLSYCNSSAWTALTTGTSTPGGVSGSVQFNSAGTFFGRSDLFVDATGQVVNRNNIYAGGGTNGYSVLERGDATYAGYTSYYLPDSTRLGYIGYGNVVQGMNIVVDKNAPLNFYTSGTLKMVVLGNGNVGVGTQNPTNKLEVGTTNAASLEGLKVRSGTSHYLELFPRLASGNFNPLVQADDKALMFSDGTLETGGLVIGPWSASAKGLRITSAGSVGIGTASPNSALQVNGEAQVGSSGVGCNGTTAGAIRYSGGTLSYCNSSAWTTLAAGSSVAAINDLNDASKDLTNGNLWLGVEMPTLANNQVNTGVGLYALDALTNTSGAGEGDYNSAFGYAALTANTTGAQNTGLGAQALYLNTTGNNNVGVGLNALYNNTSGVYNVGQGLNALFYQQTGSYNTALGGLAMQGPANYSGTGNTAVGYAAHYNAGAATDYNTSVGYATGYSLSTGDYNTLLGSHAGYDLTSGVQNTLVGYNTGRGLTTGSYNTIIGQGVTGLASGLNSNIIIADGNGNRRINIDSSGNMGVDQAAGSYKLEVNGDVISRLAGAWLRTTGAGGWYSETYGGGWHMSDSTWLRAYGGKNVYTTATMRADTQMQAGAFCDIGGANCSTPSEIYNLKTAGYVLKTGDTMTGVLTTPVTAANFPGDGSAANTLQVMGNTTMPATMTFHRSGAYAGYFGLGTDNNWRVGGWSMGATSYRLWHEGNDGVSSGLDADLLDGLSSASFARSDAASIDQWLSFRVLRNAATGSDGMYIGYGNSNSGLTRIYSAGSTGGHYYSDASGNIFRSDGATYWHSGNFAPSAYVAKTGDTMSGNLEIQNTAPTITLRDTDHMVGYIHTNSNLMYFMGGPANTGYGGWTTTPLILNLADGRAYMSQVCDPAGANCRTPAQLAAVSGVNCGGYQHMQVWGDAGYCNGSYIVASIYQCRNGTNFLIMTYSGGSCGGGGGGN